MKGGSNPPEPEPPYTVNFRAMVNNQSSRTVVGRFYITESRDSTTGINVGNPVSVPAGSMSPWQDFSYDFDQIGVYYLKYPGSSDVRTFYVVASDSQTDVKGLFAVRS